MMLYIYVNTPHIQNMGNISLKICKSHKQSLATAVYQICNSQNILPSELIPVIHWTSLVFQVACQSWLLQVRVCRMLPISWCPASSCQRWWSDVLPRASVPWYLESWRLAPGTAMWPELSTIHPKHLATKSTFLPNLWKFKVKFCQTVSILKF